MIKSNNEKIMNIRIKSEKFNNYLIFHILLFLKISQWNIINENTNIVLFISKHLKELQL